MSRGLLTPDQLRSTAWRRVLPGVYADARLAADHRLTVAAVSLVAPPTAVFGGLTAAFLWGADGILGAADPVEVVLPTGRRWSPRSPSVRVRTAPLGDGDVEVVGRFRVTGRTRTAVDLIRRGPVDEAVVVLDQLAQQRVVRLEEVRAAVAALPRVRGSAQARRAAALADGRAGSPQETRVRLVLMRAGLPSPVAQLEVRHRGRFVARVDFGWPEHRLALEYDGQWHAEPGQFARDRERLNRLTAAGWRVVFVTAADLHRPDLLAARVAEALRG
ncbi:endonuclease domain-containing protein [Modestobacter roseus]|uniref:T/G mismatch-specific endonuclease n=1 Tax=Modestobacter roseus TaxID=1181884 RepID=A0A562ITC8_9ACTN|nr:endonuclease domain-containing protein [Modestobacter roseus]TWH74287.1 T/G mismatch-specific endonuclease [Modestobacter roseus]